MAENNSIDIAMNIITKQKYRDLRACIDPSDVDFKRFKQLLHTIVLATDVMDKGLKAARDARWDAVFDDSSSNPNKDRDRAIIVLEHLIQASDVCHTMQHWMIYRKWNECLFSEMYTAFKAGRSSANPAESWYAGELGFFDYYIIPLAKKLQECQVFGVSGDEYLNYAIANRAEWQANGQAVVAEMVKKYCESDGCAPVEKKREENVGEINELTKRIRDRMGKV